MVKTVYTGYFTVLWVDANVSYLENEVKRGTESDGVKELVFVGIRNRSPSTKSLDKKTEERAVGTLI